MKSAAAPTILIKISAGALASLLIVGIFTTVPLIGNQLDSPGALGKTKSMAETQHEIVMLLIKQKEFQKAVVEANKIFEMKWPDAQEPLLLKELLFLSDQFLKQGQALLGLQVIEKSSKCFKSPTSQIALWKEKGYLYKGMNQNEKAMDCFIKARELEGKD
jgi:tetratricopeptide (TPR) repeat protein